MAKEEQNPLFTESQGGEYQPGTLGTWKDKALEEDRAKLHEGPADALDRADDHARETAGQSRLETGGMSRRQAGRVLNARVARDIIENSSRERAAAEEAERAEREQQRDKELLDLLKDKPSDSESQ